jgi:hypothetical protein
MRQAFLICCVALAGCLDGAEPGLPEAPPPAAPTTDAVPLLVDWDPEQGEHILGSVPDLLEAGGIHFRVSASPLNRPNYKLSVNPAGLKGINGTHLVANDGVPPVQDYIGTDPWFVDAVLDGGSRGQLQVRRSEQSGTSTLYFLDYRTVSPGGPGPWVNYCGDGKGGAIPIAGYYDSRRVHHQDPSWLSFACVDGVARKCNRWGYIAGNAGPGDTNWDYHQACTGMANARYCGDGQTFTREKTPILIRDEVSGYGSDYGPYDLTHPTTLPGDPDTYYIEAGWLADGTPLCLSKLRWASLAPDQCGAALPDPRFNYDKDNGGKPAKFCDDWTIQQLFAAGAVLVNGSKMMDAPLHRWRNTRADDVTTIRGYFIDRNRDGVADYPASTPPFPGYEQHVAVEGMLLRNLTGTLDEATQMRPLYMQGSGTGDLHLDDVGAGRTDPNFEGYSFLASPTATSDGGTISTLAPLSLCQRLGDLDTERGPALGCTLVKGLSYALPPP